MKNENEKLKAELRRKEKALAEAAALLRIRSISLPRSFWRCTHCIK